MKRKLLLFVFIHLWVLCSVYAQPFNIAPQHYSNLLIDQKINDKNISFYSSIKPYNYCELQRAFNYDSIAGKINIVSKSKFLRALLNYNSDTSSYKTASVIAFPRMELQGGKDLSSEKNLLETGIGFSLRGHVKNRLAVSVDYISGNSSYQNYLDSSINQSHIIPGQGYAHATDLGYCNRNLDFYINYSTKKYFDFELGKGRHFWGDGYRSLLLSDNANSYLYFKITTTIWKIKYVNLYTNFKDIRNTDGDLSKAPDKYGAFHYLSWNVSKRINFSFFESIIWQAKDSSDTRGFDVDYLNPIIFYRPVEFSLNSPDNALMGFNLSVKAFRKQLFYGQLLLDDFITAEVRKGFSHQIHPNDTTIQYGSWMNKQAFQLGLKSFDLFGIHDLNFQTEYNYVRPYTYSHRYIYESYTNFGQPLAHPLGANFWESVSFLRYYFNRFFIEAKFLYAKIGYDSTGTHFGQNIFQPTFDAPIPGGNIVVNEYKNTIAQGIRTTLKYEDINISYLISPDMNLMLTIGLTLRQQQSAIKNTDNSFVYIALRTSLFRHYSDF